MELPNRKNNILNTYFFMKYIFAFWLSVFITIQISAQKDSTSNLENTLRLKKSIAVVPFMPKMYYNDLSRLWYQTGEMKSQDQQIKDISRYLVSYLNRDLGGDCEIIDLNLTQTVSTTDFLVEYYFIGKIGYADTVPQKEVKMKWAKKKSHKKAKTQTRRGGELVSERKDRTYQFLNFNIRDKKKFRELCQELGVEQILFINQFDVKGDFGPYSSGRETDYFIKIHYSLYNNKGKLLLGNKTKFATTNEKARYSHFLKHDLKMAISEITQKIIDLNTVVLPEESKN